VNPWACFKGIFPVLSDILWLMKQPRYHCRQGALSSLHRSKPGVTPLWDQQCLFPALKYSHDVDRTSLLFQQRCMYKLQSLPAFPGSLYQSVSQFLFSPIFIHIYKVHYFWISLVSMLLAALACVDPIYYTIWPRNSGLLP